MLIERRAKLESEKLETLRFFAIIGVIIIHITAPALYDLSRNNIFTWFFANILDSLARPSVPLFLMLSGYLVYTKSYNSYHSFLNKRFKKILKPFIFWSIIYLLLRLKSGENFNVLQSLMNGTFYHLWYVYMVLGIYFFMPIISSWLKNTSKKEILLFLAIWIFSLLLNDNLLNKYLLNIDLVNFSGYIGYTVLGYFLAKFKINLWVNYVFFFVGFIVTVMGTYFLSYKLQLFNDYFYNYLSVNVILMSIGLFNLILYLNVKRTYHFIKKISHNSYMIYLSHPFILLIFSKIGIDINFISPFIGFIVSFFLCVLISLFLSISFKKIPILKYFS